MRAIILAAGVGKRLRATHDAPKCLLEIGGRSLLERQLDALRACGVDDIVICTGYRSELIDAALARMSPARPVQCVHNPRFEQGSVISLWTVREHLASPQGSLVLDADVLFDPAIMARLVNSGHDNCLLLDRDFIPGDEPVKVLVSRGRIVEFRKQVDPTLAFELCGESVGFFRLDAASGQRLAARCEHYAASGGEQAPHEEAIRDLILARPGDFGFEDITGLAWTEIDFEQDVARAREQVLPRIKAGVSP